MVISWYIYNVCNGRRGLINSIHTFDYFWMVIVSELVCTIPAIRNLMFQYQINHLNLLCQTVFSIFKARKQKSITNNSWRLNQIPQKLASDPKKKTWRKPDWLQTNFRTEQQKLFKCCFFIAEFYENSALFWYPFKNQEQFSYRKIFENNQKNPILPHTSKFNQL